MIWCRQPPPLSLSFDYRISNESAILLTSNYEQLRETHFAKKLVISRKLRNIPFALLRNNFQNFFEITSKLRQDSVKMTSKWHRNCVEITSKLRQNYVEITSKLRRNYVEIKSKLSQSCFIDLKTICYWSTFVHDHKTTWYMVTGTQDTGLQDHRSTKYRTTGPHSTGLQDHIVQDYRTT